MKNTRSKTENESRGVNYIPYKDIESNLVYIFSDVIIVDTKFRILDISPSVLNLLGYKKDQVVDKCLSEFIGSNAEILHQMIKSAYFLHSEVTFKDSQGNDIELYVSGYYLGLVSDMNGKVILMVRNSKDALKNKKSHERKFRVINQIIYRTSHDIRGPLSTIKGLTLLGVMENKSPQVEEYLKDISNCVDQLDLKLHYLRESINRENYESTNSGIEEFVAYVASRLIKFWEVYNFNVCIKSIDIKANESFYTNQLLVSIFLENFLLLVDSISEIKRTEYTLDISYENDCLRLRIQNPNLVSRFQHYFGEIFRFKGIKKLLSKDGYNFLNLRILKICQEVTKARMNIDLTKPSEITIEIPSQR
jgi:PAS domain S-box-containing protein